MYLMLKDTPVVYFNFDKEKVTVFHDELLPFVLRHRLASSKDIPMIKGWMSERILSHKRDYAVSVLKAFDLEEKDKIQICMSCKGAAVTDSYWLRSDYEDTVWEEVNLRKISFEEITKTALFGAGEGMYDLKSLHPDLTAKGMFRKTWIRDQETKELYLLKSDRHETNINTHCEILASKVLDCFDNINHVSYTGITMEDRLVCKCKNFIGEEYSFIEAHEVMEFCKNQGIDFEKWALYTFGSKFANMALIDYIILNTDRHDANYGFLMDNHTGELTDMAPLFDHNLSLIPDMLGTDSLAENSISQMLNNKETIKDLAIRMLKYSNLSIDLEKFKDIKRIFKEDLQVYENILRRIEATVWDK